MHLVNLANASSMQDFDTIIDNWHFRLRNLKIWLIMHPSDPKAPKAKKLADTLTQRISEIGEQYNQVIMKQPPVKAQDTSRYRGYETA